MPNKPGRFCSRCAKIHFKTCPNKPVWEQSGTGRGGRPWRRLRAEVFERDLFICQRCTKPVELHGVNAGICDHINPLAAGGTDKADNLQTLCKPCDRIKTATDKRGGVG